MLETRLAPPSTALRPYVWCYGQSGGSVCQAPLVVPLPARPKQVLMFFFRDRYVAHLCESGRCETSPRAIVVGPQTYYRLDLSVFGNIDAFTIHFQPAGFHHLFGVPMTELTNVTRDAHDVISRDVALLEQRLSEVALFGDRVRIAELHLSERLRKVGALDRVGVVANRLFASNGVTRVAEMAASTGLTRRQFERRFLVQVGVPPKLYARMVRFNAALDRKLASPHCTWTEIAHELNYHDQMHMVHDFHGLAGDAPSRFLGRLGAVPEFNTAFAAAKRLYDRR